MPQGSKVFLRNRALGYVSNHVPCAIRFLKRKNEYLILSCVGNSFHSYGSSHLSLLAVSDTTEDEIGCIAAEGGTVFTGSGNKIHSWRKSTTLEHTYLGLEKPAHLLLPFGPHLIAVDESNVLRIWEKSSTETFLQLMFDESSFKITALCHPSTYINKILLGSEQGRMELYNIRTLKCIYTFGSWDAAISVIEQAPALDVVAVGLASGRIILHNLRFDQTVIEFTQDWGPVTGISFRTDGPPIMVTGTVVGHVVIWNLEEKTVASQILDAHEGSVTSLICLSNEPILITSSSDNSLKMWIFDQADFGGRLLRKREGHSSPPTKVKFYDASNIHLLSAGSDSSLRVFNLITESLNYSMGKASYNRKVAKKKKEYAQNLLMPPVVDFSCQNIREKEWDNVASVHLGSPLVTTWSTDKRRMGEHKLLPARYEKSSRDKLKVTANCVFVSYCGNFVVVGYSSGHVDRFNIQSGMERCNYGSPTAHHGPVRGVAVDPLNQIVMSGCSEGIVRFWKFKAAFGTSIVPQSFGSLSLKDPISFFRVNKKNNFLCVILEDFTILLIDVEMRKIVRRLSGHTNQVTDVVFTPDSRWLISSAMDCTIRTWDLPSASLIDIFKVEHPCISLDISLNGQYLATAHVNYLGVYLWTNRTIYSHVSLRAIKENEVVPLLALPTTSGKENVIQLDESEDEGIEEDDEEDAYTSPSQIEKFITLSGLPSSRWKNLLDIDTIKKRNKPKEPVKAAPSAPFFLPTVNSLDFKFDFSSVLNEEDGIKTVRLDSLKNYTAFGRELEKTKETNNFQPVIKKLKEMSPSAIDAEINEMGLEIGDATLLLLQFLKTVECMFESKKDFELAQSYLSLFLKVHRRVIVDNEELLGVVRRIHSLQKGGWAKIQSDIQYCLCVINHLKIS